MNKNQDGSNKPYADNAQHEDINPLSLSLSIHSDLSAPLHSSDAVLNASLEDSSPSLPSEVPPTPLPKLQMIVISIVLFSEPLTSTILFPFIYFMVKDFHLSDDEKEIGTYAGWIASVFFVAQFSTAILWGRISDKYGRRPVLLTGLLGNIISSSMFGLSKSLWWALASRAFCGIVNGNGGAARSMLSEITDSTNRAKAFSIFGFCWGMGMIAGPAIGGYLCNPVEQFPGLFGNSLFLKEYPYFLPCFVSSLGSLVGYIIGFIYLKESNPMVIARRNREDLTKNEETGTIHSLDEENSALLNTQKRASTLYKTFSSDNQHGTNTASISTKPDTVSQSLLKSIPMSSYIVALAYSIFGFHSMVFDEVLPLYFLAPSYAGGLGSTSVEFARALSIVGIQQLFCQFVVYPKLCRHFSILKMTRVCFFILTPIYLLFPELTTYKGWLEASVGDEVARQWAFRSVYMLILSLRYFMNSVCFTSLMIMVSNSASPEILGTVNGICQTCLCLVRSLAPTVGGTVWSISLRTGKKYPFDHHMVYYIIGLMTFIGFIHSFLIPKSVSMGGKKS